jgi:soluble lytic murein transglycosylase-like protein
MRDGISGGPLYAAFPYAKIINDLSNEYDVSPLVVAAIKYNETGLGHGPQTETDISGDGGRGIMQLTSSYPDDWTVPTSNIEWAIRNYIVPAWAFWETMEQGAELVRCIAASYNAGTGAALQGHKEGNVDKYTTNNYGQRALESYLALQEGEQLV